MAGMTLLNPAPEPALLVAGDTAKWAKVLPANPASEGWVLTYRLVNPSATLVITATAGPSGEHLINVPAATTATWAAGFYAWRAQASKADEVYTVAAGQMQIAPAFATGGMDARSDARKALDAVEAVILGRASSAVAEYQIAGRQLRHIPIPELLTLRDKLRADVVRENTAQALANTGQLPGRIFVRFGA